MNRLLFNNPIWPSNQKHPVSFWRANSKIEYICGTLQDQMLKKMLTRQVSEPFLLFNEPLPDEGDPAASHCSRAIECTPPDSPRLQLNIKESQVCIYTRVNSPGSSET